MLSAKSIALQAQAADKQDAIRQAGELLVTGGFVEAAYIEGMLAREETMSTYLGNGVAIPHGQFDDLAQVKETGISVLQLPEGVEWDEGETALLVIGIAANSDEHINILSNLANAIEDPAAVQELVDAKDAATIIAALSGDENAE